MTVLAGAFSRTATPLPEQLRLALEQAISRHSDDRVVRFSDDYCYFGKIDVGAFGQPATQADESGATFVVGEPFLDRGGSQAAGRLADVQRLHGAFAQDGWAPLTAARGVFAGAHYSPSRARVTILTDKLGIRPMYYWVDKGFVVFATALRILESLREIPKELDLRGATELASFGFPLGDRTPFSSIRSLLPGELLQVGRTEVSHQQYWRWEDVTSSDRPVDELAREAYERFAEGVQLRIGDDSTTVAFLSGGLDSRSILTALRSRGTAVHTFGFSFPGTHDHVLGAAYAKKLGAIHTDAPWHRERPDWAMLLSRAWAESPFRAEFPAERPQIAWSGDGGSVVLGHVYLNDSLVALARQGDRRAIVDAITKKWSGELPARLVRPEVLRTLATVSQQGLAEELDRFPNVEAGRRLHLVLLYNDQRRHLAEHFEAIDLHRTEFELPFFDSEFVRSVLSVPIDQCVGHRFYMRWLRHFPDVITSVPWQAYPGHEPCPLPMPADISYQWGRVQPVEVQRARRGILRGKAAEMLGASDFPHAILNRPYLRLAATLNGWGLRDMGYVIRAAHIFYRYASASGGRIQMPSPN